MGGHERKFERKLETFRHFLISEEEFKTLTLCANLPKVAQIL